jgi:GWxTD domain-containing protein
MRFVLFLLLASSLSGLGQSLSGLNLNYWYDPNAEIEFIMTPVNTEKRFQVYYQLVANRRESGTDNYSINWEFRSNLNEKSGHNMLALDSTILKNAASWKGVLTVPPPSDLGYVVAQITNNTTQQTFFFYKPVDPQWPVNTIVSFGGYPLLKPYMPNRGTVTFGSSEKKMHGFLYRTTFLPARPPHAEMPTADPFLKADSTLTVTNLFVPKSNGLYLFQTDTNTIQGVSFMVTNPAYPKYNTIEGLTGPLVYICTDDEYKQLQEANGEKAVFDKVILEITRDKDRARNLMRSYFQRVEAANRYFTDYKEGWKTDRGMIYIVFGLPDEVSRTPEREVWDYQAQNTKFVFNKTKSIFSPESYKLQRDSQYMPKWFSMIDLWRKSRL